MDTHSNPAYCSNELYTLLSRMMSDSQFREDVDRKMNQICSMIENGYQIEKIGKSIKIPTVELPILFDLAKSRIKVRNKYEKYDRVFLDSYSASYSTPQNVAVYRSFKLKGRKILDIGCGAGMQSIFLSMNSAVTGIDMSRDRILMAKLNNIALSGKANFTWADGLNLNIKKGDYDTIYCDPLRAAGSQERKLEELQPDPVLIVEKYGNYVKDFVFDLPPFLDKAKLDKLPGTLEYLSVNGQLARLTLYYGENKERKFEAVMPDKDQFFSGNKFEEPMISDKIMKFLFIPDPALFYSDLHSNYCNKLGLRLITEEKRKAIYSGEFIPDDFMGEVFKVNTTCQEEKLHDYLRRESIGKIILRYSSHMYYEEKRGIEKDLSGNKTAHLFKIGDDIVICEKLLNQSA